jgi:hypothetical protein
MGDFEPTRLTDYSTPSLITELRRVAGLIEHDRFTVAEFEKLARVSRHTLINRFGGWRSALEAAGLAHLYNAPNLSAKSHNQLAKTLSKDQLLEEVRAVASEIGVTTLTKELFNRHARINGESVRRQYGTWTEVLRAAGLEQVPHGRRYSGAECHENLLAVWTHYGRPPKYKEMAEHPSKVGGKAYMKRWGTWMKAVHAFAQRVESDLATPQELAAESVTAGARREIASIPRVIKEVERHEIRLGLRYAVLKRDRFRCVICGRAPATHSDCVLHVDHIMPWSKGGRTVVDNLRSTCSDCNLGKGDRE